MATTSASIALNSPDITADVLSLTTSTQFKKAGTNTGIDQTTGAARALYATAQTDTVLFAASDYADNKADKIYIKNPSSNAAEYVSLKIGSQSVGRLYAGDFALIPWDGTADFKFSTSAINMKIEHILFHEG